MSARKPKSGQGDLLADVTRLSQFPRKKQRQPGKFDGPVNPREIRALSEMMGRPITREALDAVAGASNGPELINQLRDRGLEIPCFKLGAYDRDGQWVFRGLYMLTAKDRIQVARTLRGGNGDAANAPKHTARKATTERKNGGRRDAK